MTFHSIHPAISIYFVPFVISFIRVFSLRVIIDSSRPTFCLDQFAKYQDAKSAFQSFFSRFHFDDSAALFSRPFPLFSRPVVSFKAPFQTSQKRIVMDRELRISLVSWSSQQTTRLRILENCTSFIRLGWSRAV